MIRITDEIVLGDREISERFVRASGPGGQNVNKVATAVELRFDVRQSSLPPEVRQRLITLAGQRVTADGVLLIDSRAHRTQGQNREAALARLVDLIQRATRRPKARRPTRPKAGAREKRLRVEEAPGDGEGAAHRQGRRLGSPMMSDPDPRAEYTRRLAARQDDALRWARADDAAVRARQALAALAAVLAWFAFWARTLSAWWLAVPAAVFVVLAVVHGRVIRRRQSAERRVAFYQRGIARLDHRWSGQGTPVTHSSIPGIPTPPIWICSEQGRCSNCCARRAPGPGKPRWPAGCWRPRCLMSLRRARTPSATSCRASTCARTSRCSATTSGPACTRSGSRRGAPRRSCERGLSSAWAPPCWPRPGRPRWRCGSPASPARSRLP